jgi:hypothetical protein
MLTKIPSSRVLRAAFMTLGLAVLWVVVALLRTGVTFHLAPLLVAAAFPVGMSYDADEPISAGGLAVASLAGLAAALVTTLILAALGEMTGPSLLPFGGAATEAVVFAAVGAIGGFVIASLLTRR